MKMKLLMGGGGLCATALAGVAAAQVLDGGWPQISLSDLEQCRPVIAQAHNLEIDHIRYLMGEACSSRVYSRTHCQVTRRWLANSKAKDDAVWFFEGNDRCSSGNLPCYGVQTFNEPRTGGQAAHWRQLFQDAAREPYGVVRRTDVRSGVRDAEKCVARIWAAKYDRTYPPVVKSMVVSASPAFERVAAPATAVPAAAAQPAIVAPPVLAPAAASASLAAVPILAAATVAPAVLALVDIKPGQGDASAAKAPAADPVPPPVAPAAEAKAAPPEPPATAGADSLATAKPAEATAPAEGDKELAGAPAAPAVPADTSGGCADAKASAADRVAACTTALATLDPKDPNYATFLGNRMVALAASGHPADAIADGDKLAAIKGGGDGKLVACKARVLAKQQLDRALINCFSTGKSNDPEVMELRGRIHLLAGRYADAWNDLNVAWTAGKANAALFLRGLASAGEGKMTGALKDMAQAEEAQEGLFMSYAAEGYSLAAALAGKAMASQEAFDDAAPAAPAAAVVAPPAAAVAAPPAAVVAEPPAPAPMKPSSVVTAVPAAFTTGVAAAAGTAAAAAGLAAAALPPPVVVPPAPIVPLLDQREPVVEASIKGVGDAGHAPIVEPSFTPEELAKPATDCLEPLQAGDRENPGSEDIFRNKCGYQVRFTYCNVRLPDSALGEPFECGSTLPMKFDVVAAKGVQAAHLGREVAFFGCRGTARPDLVYTENKGLFGYCR